MRLVNAALRKQFVSSSSAKLCLLSVVRVKSSSATLAGSWQCFNWDSQVLRDNDISTFLANEAADLLPPGHPTRYSRRAVMAGGDAGHHK